MDIQYTPVLTAEEMRIMGSLFEAQRPGAVLEWGIGGSTMYWPRQYDFINRWVAVEHNEVYVEFIVEQVIDTVEVLHLKPPQYWESPIGLGPFNLILVDGRHRVKCLEAATRALADKGIVVLHDSGRDRYKPAWAFYPWSETLYPGKLTLEGVRGPEQHGLTVFWQDEFVNQLGWYRGCLE